MYPTDGRKKNCTPRLAWSSLSTVGLDGSSAASPSDGDVNTLPESSSMTFGATSLSELGRSGAFLYA